MASQAEHPTGVWFYLKYCINALAKFLLLRSPASFLGIVTTSYQNYLTQAKRIDFYSCKKYRECKDKEVLSPFGHDSLVLE